MSRCVYTPFLRSLLLPALLGAAACSAPANPESDAGPADSGSPPDAGADGGLVSGRPYGFHIPASYQPGTPTPLLIMLHGYGASGVTEDLYLQLGSLSEEKGFLYAYPDGTVNPVGSRFWNATDACCNLYGSTVNDVAYLNAVIDDLESHYTVDPTRIYLFGHSNGGFMVNRLGCDLSARIAAFVSMAGDTWEDQSHCQTTSPVSMIQFQGTADAVVSYDGGVLYPGAATYPGALQTAADWAALDGCDGGLQDGGVAPAVVPGLVTTIARYSGCARGAVEVWSVQGGSHVPALAARLERALLEFPLRAAETVSARVAFSAQLWRVARPTRGDGAA